MLRLYCALTLLFSGYFAAPTAGQDTFYRVAAGGQFSNASSWAPFNPPFTEGPGGIDDNIRFNLSFSPGNRYSIENVFGDNNQLVVQDDSLMLEVIGYELHDAGVNADSSIVVGRDAGDQGNLLLRSDALPNSTLEAVNVVLGLAENSSGTITIDDPDLAWNNSGFILVGSDGNGTLNVFDGAQVQANAILAGAVPETIGVIHVSGVGSHLNNTLGLGVGTEFFGSDGGTGQLLIMDGGTVDVGGDAIIGEGPSGSGSVTVDGAGSMLNIGELLSLDFDSSLAIADGGNAICSECDSDGSICATGTDTRLNVAGLLSCRPLEIQDGANVCSDDCCIKSGLLLIDGPQSELDTNNIFEIRTDLGVVTNGGQIHSGWQVRLVGNGNGLNFSLSGQDSQIDTTEFVVGESLPVCLTVSNQAHVSCGTAVINEGNLVSLSETVVAECGTWSSDNLVIGDSGTGIFRMETGSAVSCNVCNVGGVVGLGLFDAQDAGSVLVVTDQMRLGSDAPGSGNGILNIDNGAEVEIANQLHVDDESLVSLADGRLIVNTVDLMPSGVFEFIGGVLQVQTFNGDLENDGGVFAPGVPAGVTTITGEYVQQNTASLQIEIGGTTTSEYDFVDVGESIQLNGQLNIVLIENYQPTPQQQFTVAMAGSILGSFANAADNQRVETTDGSGSFIVRYGASSPIPNQIILSQFEPAFVLGDINGDGEVNLLDVGPFVDLLSSGNYDPAADINLDGQVNLLDVGPFIALLGG